jgi:hypothetical protein
MIVTTTVATFVMIFYFFFLVLFLLVHCYFIDSNKNKNVMNCCPWLGLAWLGLSQPTNQSTNQASKQPSKQPSKPTNQPSKQPSNQANQGNLCSSLSQERGKCSNKNKN